MSPGRRQAAEARRRERYAEVVQRAQAGESARRIAHELNLSRTTVTRYLRAGEFPAHSPTTVSWSQTEAHADFFRRRWADGCHSPRQLWLEVHQLGAAYSEAAVWRWTARHRAELKALAPMDSQASATPVPLRSTTLSPYRAAWLVCKPVAELKPAEQTWLSQLTAVLPAAATAHELAQQFQAMVRQRRAADWSEWLRVAKACALPDVRQFARSLEQDEVAVCAALSSPFSNGRTEGHVHRLKLIKRSMYGRAKFDRLRQRVLFAP